MPNYEACFAFALDAEDVLRSLERMTTKPFPELAKAYGLDSREQLAGAIAILQHLFAQGDLADGV